MTERKPPDQTFESWIDRQIREATERGEFEGLRGAGQPIPGAGTQVDENWWLRDYLRREGVPADGMLPESLVLRRDVERIHETAAELDSEAEIRAAVSDLNRRIVAWLRTPTPPQVPLAPVNVEDVLSRRRPGSFGRPSARPLGGREASAGEGTSASPKPEPPQRRWWRRRTG
ncbi:DUF1992 domain-containing protein [Nocardia puris]|uniref:Uncharacterized protein DUF1992 n=1 Tax=Nocardia puris TaxID=208602 RepID=A0A366DVK2_9NOCA|nr:DUF1992 domain-containing protein [Nocardia puris]MBF6210120.1 DUF1992 domain-containing protein [Nocardia puris]MBF6368311.1 DUF1992 domain-containing protein [Nocardia puris]MBF6457971.1 DUF1992 domain-containing protein [Nocardia puris]RBO94131.1 uncharacterized protein DUF1992 [Nocardia puris]